MASAAPDFHIKSFTASTAPDRKVTFQVQVCNAGTSTNSTFDVELYYNRASAPICNTSDNGHQYVSGLAAGACTTLKFTRTGATLGAQTAWVFADADCVVTEASETNNTASTSYTVKGADLYFTSFTVTPGIDRKVTYEATVCNKGVTTTKIFDVELYYSRSSAPTCSTSDNGHKYLSGLAAGACTTLKFTRTGATLGAQTAWIFADADCVVTEESESNNTATAKYTVKGADLYISAFTVTPGIDRVVNYQATVCNKGLTTTKLFDVELYYSRTSAPTCSTSDNGHQYVSGLKAGACTTLKFKRTGATLGAQTAWVFADADCVVTEESESNNTTSTKYTVKGADLYISSFTVTPAIDRVVNYQVTVCNKGLTTTKLFDVELYYSRTSAPICSTSDNGHQYVSGLKAGACTTLKFKRTGATLGAQTAWVFADADCVVTEESETNNKASTGYTVKGADLYISAFTVTPAIDRVVNYQVTVCNKGLTTTKIFDVELYYSRSSAPTCSTSDNGHQYVSGLAAGACTTLKFKRTGATLGAQTAWVFADADCVVTEESESNNTASTKYTVKGADLHITSFTVTQGLDRAMTYQATVCNKGLTTTKIFDVELYYSRSSAPICSTSDNGHQYVSGLAAGACTTLKFKRTGATLGAQTAWVFADADCVVTEESESNNTTSTKYTVKAPDLYVKSLTATPGLDQKVNFEAQVCNKGGGTTKPFDVELFHNRTTSPGCQTPDDQHSIVTGLGSSACKVVKFSRTGAPLGSYTAWVMADADCAMVEEDENNNGTSAAYTVSGADLYIKSLKATPGPDQQVVYAATVCNQGQTTAVTFDVELYYHLSTTPTCSTADSQNQTVAGLAAGACATLSFTRKAAPVGTYSAWVMADADCAVKETKEGNNTGAAVYSVKAVDLYVKSFKVTPYGTQVVYEATVCNQGAPTAKPVDVELYYHRTSSPGCSTADDQHQNFTGLVAGGCKTLKFTRTGAPLGSYTAWLMVDADCAVSEASETNNLSSAAYKVAPSPDFHVSVLTASVTGSKTMFNATVCNKGGSTTAGFSLGLHYSRTSPPGCSNKPDLKAGVAGLAAGACTSRTFTRQFAPAGPHVGWLMADSGCQVFEANESNNTRNVIYVVTSRAADMGSDGSASDLGTDGAQPDLGVDAATVDAGMDAASVDAGVDADMWDAGGDAASADAGGDAATADAGGDVGAADAGGDTASVDSARSDLGADVTAADTGVDATAAADTGGDAAWADSGGGGNDGSSPKDGGCDCSSAGDPAPGSALLALVLLLLLGLIRRRQVNARRQAPRSRPSLS